MPTLNRSSDSLDCPNQGEHTLQVRRLISLTCLDLSAEAYGAKAEAAKADDRIGERRGGTV